MDPKVTWLVVILWIALIVVGSILAMAGGVPIGMLAMPFMATGRYNVLNRTTQMKVKACKSINMFAQSKGYYILESNKVFRIYPCMSGAVAPVAPVATLMNELAVADWLMFEPFLQKNYILPESVDLTGLTPEERDAKILEMTQ